jgi:hypothetical protein
VIPEPRVHAHRGPDFWEAYQATPAWEFDRFEAYADRGGPYEVALTSDPVAREREDVEASLQWTKAFLGLA